MILSLVLLSVPTLARVVQPTACRFLVFLERPAGRLAPLISSLGSSLVDLATLSSGSVHKVASMRGFRLVHLCPALYPSGGQSGLGALHEPGPTVSLSVIGSCAGPIVDL